VNPEGAFELKPYSQFSHQRAGCVCLPPALITPASGRQPMPFLALVGQLMAELCPALRIYGSVGLGLVD
jgi:hypothetical protein